MPATVRLGDQCTGHGCFPPRVNDSASSDVFVNGIGVHRVGDHWVEHCCLSWDTKVVTNYGWLTIPEIIEIISCGGYVQTLSKYKNKWVPSIIREAHINQTTKDMVVLSENPRVSVTEDHKVLMKDGVTYKEAKDVNV